MLKSKKASVYIFIFNDRGELLLQLRVASDDDYPLHWDFSAAGHVEPGESPDEAANRELMEELGIETPLSYTSEDDYQGEATYLYKGLTSTGFNPGSEVESIKFTSILEIQNMIEAKEKFHPEFLYLFNKLFI